MDEIGERRSLVLHQLETGTITMRTAAQSLRISCRQARRVWRRYLIEGESGLAHRGSGRPSNRAFGDDIKKEIILRYRSRFADWGPTRFARELEGQGVVIDHETVRRWLLASGAWKPRRSNPAVRQACRHADGFGQMLTLIPARADWLDIRFTPDCLLFLHDEATGTVLASIARKEYAASHIGLLRRWIDRYGIPASVRCPRRLFAVEDTNPTLEQQLAGEEPRPPFLLVCERLGLETILLSPSNERISRRAIEPFRCRLEVELGRLDPKDAELADALLRGPLGDALNAEFALPPDRATDFHVPILDGTDLDAVFRPAI
jgi:transposase